LASAHVLLRSRRKRRGLGHNLRARRCALWGTDQGTPDGVQKMSDRG
jgi:hypothetical protein